MLNFMMWDIHWIWKKLLLNYTVLLVWVTFPLQLFICNLSITLSILGSTVDSSASSSFHSPPALGSVFQIPCCCLSQLHLWPLRCFLLQLCSKLFKSAILGTGHLASLVLHWTTWVWFLTLALYSSLLWMQILEGSGDGPSTWVLLST